ncbi:hypothetical protein ARMGADRAFT_339277 [Armillaria gallica]|uniref:Uncharacterized protein n=1 Tax=Armillaria gallica TaxID=47427 RepID=A0A2H3DJQ1_ARMGA|nr:hypothetical protein ARMGADRAFT_339277 [Armillaria gallica]
MVLVPAEVAGIIKSCIELATRSVPSCVTRAMPVRVCKILDVNATIATNTSSLIWLSFSGDVVDLSSQGHAVEMKRLSLL